jgi:hypothetical protein
MHSVAGDFNPTYFNPAFFNPGTSGLTTANNLAVGSPVISSPTLGQTHVLAATSVAHHHLLYRPTLGQTLACWLQAQSSRQVQTIALDAALLTATFTPNNANGPFSSGQSSTINGQVLF